MTPEQSLINATLLGYVAGLACGERDDGQERNPYAYLQPEALSWFLGFDQGKARRVECGVSDPKPPEPLQCVMIPPPECMGAIEEVLNAAQMAIERGLEIPKFDQNDIEFRARNRLLGL